MISDDKIMLVHYSTFLKVTGIIENSKGFKVQKPSPEEFQLFLTQIGYNGKFKAKEFKKSLVFGLWNILMLSILRVL